MDSQKEIRALLVILGTFIGIGLLFWGASSLLSGLSGSGGEVVQEGVFEGPSDAPSRESSESSEGDQEEAESGEEGEESFETDENPSDQESQSENSGSENTDDLTEAEKILQESLLRASETNKSLFVRFGAPWCPGCWQLAGFLETLEVQEIFQKHFIDTEFDIDAIEGGRDLLTEMAGEKPELPWYAIFDSDGKLLATSDTYEESIGFMPATPKDREHFLTMFQKSGEFSEEELKQLGAALDTYIENNTR
ncbi:MAG: thioredoxin family protein [Candidatus Omnitrophica bacterium]|nr:thioredoxin family protein [Candidatus Omnitrophota bacterium]